MFFLSSLKTEQLIITLRDVCQKCHAVKLCVFGACSNCTCVSYLDIRAS